MDFLSWQIRGHIGPRFHCKVLCLKPLLSLKLVVETINSISSSTIFWPLLDFLLPKFLVFGEKTDLYVFLKKKPEEIIVIFMFLCGLDQHPEGIFLIFAGVSTSR